MRCNHCSADPMKFRLRKFPIIDAAYLLCQGCQNAQKRPSGLKTDKRGQRPLDREKTRRGLAVSSASCKFKVLVWGPAPGSANPAAATRFEIRDELNRMGHDAFFSEELAVPAVPTNVLELVQLKKVNLVVNIAASFGSLAEFENYGVLLGKRHLVFLNEAARGGFTDTGTRKLFRANGGTDEFFKDDDISSGVLVLAALDWVTEKAYLQKWLSSVVEEAKDSLL
jgi:hypothetical protein